MSLIPSAFWALEVPASEEIIPAAADNFGPSPIFRITMAAIDPTAKPASDSEPKRATLKILRRRIPGLFDDDEAEESSDDEEDEDEDEDEDGEGAGSAIANGKGGKKDSSSSKKKAAAEAAIAKAIKNAAAAEKMAVDGEDDESDEDSEDDSDDDDFELALSEFVVCTLDSDKQYQQTLDITLSENEEVFFKVVGNYSVYLTGNYIVLDDHDHDHDYDSDEEDFDLEDIESDEEDELDDLADPRIQEIDSEEEEKPKKLTKAEKKALKRSASEVDDKEATEKLSKKQQKKLKANDGKAVGTAGSETPEGKKKVQFAKELEQGPTPSPANKNKPNKDKEAKAEPSKKADGGSGSGKRVVNGVTVEDKTVGTGPSAKNGQKLSMRYIGKLTDGSVFDKNVKGKPFSFKLGKGEVIKGWDVGLVGMQTGGERRITVPASLAYGSKKLPGIPANSTLVFEVKLLSIN